MKVHHIHWEERKSLLISSPNWPNCFEDVQFASFELGDRILSKVGKRVVAKEH